MENQKRPFPALFYALAIGLIIIGSLILTSIDKGDVVIGFNQLHNPHSDWVFKYLTHAGSGWVLLIIFLGALWVNRKLAVALVLISALQGVAMLVFKGLLFPDALRPLASLTDSNLHIVEGLTPVFSRSFPSGHTMTAFAIGTLLAHHFRSKIIHVLLVLYAVLIGISRIYLALHFLVDTLVGAGIGVFISYLTHKLIYEVDLLRYFKTGESRKN